jgi:hypothetical protein
MPKRARLFVLMLTGLVLASPAWAQFGSRPGAGSVATGRGVPTTAPAQPAQPAALPGLRPNSGPAPITKPPSEMAPTEALFDAVNRSDIGAARDATSRGADLNARNVLGLTALELAVDLRQNDIAFLLLSLRDAEPAPRPNGKPAPRTAAAKPTPVVHRPAAPARTVSAPQQQQGPSDGGSPVPNAGFLGFGGR